MFFLAYFGIFAQGEHITISGADLIQLDRYILRQLFGPFVFFMMVFVGILWINQALMKVDIVVENGQPARIFFELSSYLLPAVIEVAIPISAFAASVLITNRLYGESELVVMMNAGRSVWQLARPYFIFGAACAIATTLVVHFIVPWSKTRLLDRQDEIGREYVTQIVKQGEFVSADGRYTFFFGYKGQNGDLADIMIHEQREEGGETTHVARTGQAITIENKPKILLFDGVIQEFDPENILLSTVDFESLSYDLSVFGEERPARSIDSQEYSTLALYKLYQTADAGSHAQKIGKTFFHSRMMKPFLTLLAPILGLSMLLLGGFTRGGFLPRIILAVFVMFGVEALRGYGETLVLGSNMHWITVYLPLIFVALIIFTALSIGTRDLSKLFSWPRRVRGAT